jgi:hypothetical protein
VGEVGIEIKRKSPKNCMQSNDLKQSMKYMKVFGFFLIFVIGNYSVVYFIKDDLLRILGSSILLALTLLLFDKNK